MGIIGKAILAGGAYYLYKQHQEKKKAQRGEVDFPNSRDAPNDYYPHGGDNKSQYNNERPDARSNYYPQDHKGQIAENAYQRDMSRRDLDYPQSNPSYQSFEPKREYSNTKY